MALTGAGQRANLPVFIFDGQNCAMSELTEVSTCSSVDFNFPELWLS